MTHKDKAVQETVDKAIAERLHSSEQRNEQLSHILKGKQGEVDRLREERDVYKNAYQNLARQNNPYLFVNSCDEPDF